MAAGMVSRMLAAVSGVVMKGRKIEAYRPGVNKVGEVVLPATNLTLPNGTLLRYQGRQPPKHAGGGVWIALTFWLASSNLVVAAALEPLPHLHIKSKPRFLHISVSYPDHTPTWDEMVQVAEAIAGPDLDMAMIKPRRADYVNEHAYCLHWWELPVEWGLQ